MDRKNFKKVFNVLEEMLRQKNSPLAITAALNTSYINIYRAKLAVAERKGPDELFELFDYKKGDRKVSIAFDRASRYKMEQVEQVLDVLLKLDEDLKSSAVEKEILLETAVAQIVVLVK